MLSPLATAFRTLTVLPVPGENSHRLARSIIFFPIVGMTLGAAVLAGQAAITALNLNGWILPAVLLVAGETLLTGALHVGGLADVAQAFGCGRSREKVLEQLNEGRQGTLGLVAGLFDLLIKVAAWALMFDSGRPLVVFWSIVFGRCVQAFLLGFLPNARSDSLAAAFTGTDARLGALTAMAVTVSLAIWISGPMAGIAYSGVALLAGSAWGWHCLNRIGGITDGCLGAANELAEVSILLAAWALME